MELIVEGKKAVLKKGSSFDYVSENRSLSDADDYTLSITLPLAGCPQNIAIFGHVNRADFTHRSIVKEATLIDNALCKNGVVTVVGADESDVKVQFLEGRSVQNFDTTFDDIYINELDLGTYPQSKLPETPTYLTLKDGWEWTYLPWWNESGDGVFNNEVFSDSKGKYYWGQDAKDIGKLSYQLYLIVYAKRICKAVGYTFDFSAWEHSDDRFLLVCNALPASWDMPEFAKALPRWTVAEFFTELEKLLVCEFDIDHRSKHIAMTYTHEVQAIGYEVQLENVLDAIATEVSYGDDLVQYRGSANIKYADRGDDGWKMSQCQWLVNALKNGKLYKEFETVEEFKAYLEVHVGTSNLFIGYGVYTTADEPRNEYLNTLYHCKENDCYYILFVEQSKPYENATYYNYWIKLMQVNEFGDLIRNKGDNNDIELNIVPARIENAGDGHGYAIYLSPSSINGEEDVDEDGIRQTATYSNLLKGEADSDGGYYDHIHVAYWDGTSRNPDMTYQTNESVESIRRYKGIPCPIADERLSLKNRYAGYLGGINVDTAEKMQLSWIATSIPDVRSVFCYRGKKYLCAKITATFTEDGMSQLLKGDFYRIKR